MRGREPGTGTGRDRGSEGRRFSGLIPNTEMVYIYIYMYVYTDIYMYI